MHRATPLARRTPQMPTQAPEPADAPTPWGTWHLRELQRMCFTAPESAPAAEVSGVAHVASLGAGLLLQPCCCCRLVPVRPPLQRALLGSPTSACHGHGGVQGRQPPAGMPPAAQQPHLGSEGSRPGREMRRKPSSATAVGSSSGSSRMPSRDRARIKKKHPACNYTLTHAMAACKHPRSCTHSLSCLLIQLAPINGTNVATCCFNMC